MNVRKKFVFKLLRVAEMNEKKTLDYAHYRYIMKIVNIHKQAELTKTMDSTYPLLI